MFDEYLRERAERTGERVRAVRRRHDDYDEYVDGKPRYDGVRSFLASRGIELPDGTPEDPPTPRRSTGSATARTSSCSGAHRPRRRRGLRGLGALRRAARDAGLRRAVVSSSANCRGRARGGRDRSTSSRRSSTATSRASRACRASPRPTRSSPAPRAARASSRRRRRSSRTRSPGSRPAAPAASASSSASTASASADALREHGADIVVKDLAELLEERVIEHPAFAVEPWALRETELRPRRARPDASRCSRSPTATSGCAATSTRASPPACPARTSTASTRSARCRTPRRPTATRRRARRSSTSPTASSSGCSSTTSRSTCATASSREHERVLDLRAGVLRRAVAVALAGRAARCACPRRGWCRSPSAAIAAILYEVEPVDERGAPRRAVRARRQRATARASRATTRARPPRCSAPLVAEEHYATTTCVRARPPHQAQRPADGAAMDHEVDGPDGTAIDGRGRRRRSARVTVAADVEPGSGCASSSSSPTAGRAAARCRRCATRSAARWPRRATPAGTGCAPRSASTSTTSGTRADVEIDGDAELQQAVRFCAVPRAAGRRARRAARDPGQGADRAAATTATRSGTPRRSCCPVLTYTAPEAAADALRWRHVDARPRARARAAARPRRRRVPVADDRAAQECSGYWPAGTAAFHVNADIADAVVRYSIATGDDRSSSATSALELLVETARLWRSLGHHDTRRRASASTASPVPTSTARSPTTTSTRT